MCIYAWYSCYRLTTSIWGIFITKFITVLVGDISSIINEFRITIRSHMWQNTVTTIFFTVLNGDSDDLWPCPWQVTKFHQFWWWLSLVIHLGHCDQSRWPPKNWYIYESVLDASHGHVTMVTYKVMIGIHKRMHRSSLPWNVYSDRNWSDDHLMAVNLIYWMWS